MVTLMRVLRDQRRLTQAAALDRLERRARQLGENRFALSLRQYARIEAGEIKTAPYPARRRVIEAEYGRPYEDLVASIQEPAETPALLAASTLEADPAEHYAAIVAHLAQLDHETGPRPTLQPALSVYRSIYETAMAAQGPDRDRYLRLAAQCAELVGWLQQDSGQPARAEQWTHRALDLAEAVEAWDLIPDVLMRRSSIAVDLDRADDALLLAERALRRGSSSLDQALALREVAASHALKGHATDFRKAVDSALEYADGTLPRSSLAPYCTVPYLRSEAGAAALKLGDPHLAVSYLDPAVHEWPAAQPRDRTVCTARLALAFAQIGEVDHAEDVVVKALETTTGSSSPRFDTTLELALQTMIEVDGQRAGRLRERLQPSLL
jgi:hypothetical protein